MHHDSGARWATLVAIVWLVVTSVLSAATPPSIVLDPLFPMAPLAACAVLSARMTAVFAAVAVVLSVFSGFANDVWGTDQQWVRLAAVVLVSAAAVLIAVVRIRRESQLERLTHIAEAAQRVILPVLPAATSDVRVEARYRSASRDALVGGDLYDCSLTNGRTRFLIGDARGKGIGAVEQAARVIRAFRQSSGLMDDLGHLAADMDAYLRNFLDEEGFVTALLVDVSVPGSLTLAASGHPPPLLVRRDGSAELLEVPPGLPLGLGGTAEPVTVSWTRGDRLLLYTDGLSEARDAHGTFLSPLDLAPTIATAPPDSALDAVLEQVRRHVPGQLLVDDLAVVLLENTGEQRPPTFGGAPASAAFQR